MYLSVNNGFIFQSTMASSDLTESDDGSDLYDCQVCLHFMMDKNPRTLHCLHTFCEDCLQKLLDNKTIQCPTCRAVTTIAKNDVKLLPVNFVLNKMKGLKEKMKDMKEVIDEIEVSARDKRKSIDSKDVTKCEVCNGYKATFKCKECVKIMCPLCKSKHDKVPLFKSHFMQKELDLSNAFCHPHQSKITHACLKCATPLCMTCILFDHSEHGEYVEIFDTAIAKFTTEIIEKQEKIESKLETLGNKEKMIKANAVMVWFRKSLIMEKMELIRRQFEDITAESESYQQLLKAFSETHRSCLGTLDDMKKKCMETDTDILKAYVDVKTKAEQILDMIETKILEDNKIPALEEQQSRKGIREEEIKILSVQKLIATVNQSSTFRCIGQMAVIGKHALSVTDFDPPHVIRIDEQGQVVSKYMAEEQGGEVIGVNVFDNQICIVQMRGITVLKPEEDGNDKNIFYQLQLHEESKICVVDHTNILFSDPPKGSIKLYNTDLDVTEVLLEGLKYPTYISTTLTNNGRMFLITDRSANLIKVFNENFKLRNTIGNDKLKYPQSTVITEMNTVLVCDENNFRISHYMLDGKFLTCAVTEAQLCGCSPRGLAYSFPNLWTSRYNGYWLKCFELKKC